MLPSHAVIGSEDEDDTHVHIVSSYTWSPLPWHEAPGPHYHGMDYQVPITHSINEMPS